MTTRAGSGHPSSSWSATGIAVALFFGGVLRYDADLVAGRDRFIMSKGHASPLLCTVLTCHTSTASGCGSCVKLATRCRVTPSGRNAGVSKRQPARSGKGLSVGLGHILGGRLNGHDYHVFVLLGDECQAGQI